MEATPCQRHCWEQVTLCNRPTQRWMELPPKIAARPWPSFRLCLSQRKEPQFFGALRPETGADRRLQALRKGLELAKSARPLPNPVNPSDWKSGTACFWLHARVKSRRTGVFSVNGQCQTELGHRPGATRKTRRKCTWLLGSAPCAEATAPTTRIGRVCPQTGQAPRRPGRRARRAPGPGPRRVGEGRPHVHHAQQAYDLGETPSARAVGMGGALTALGVSTVSGDLNPANMPLARVYHLDTLGPASPEAQRQTYGSPSSTRS